ncbi:MAG TPA: anhydro-N-acetylmuramic acid kinase [Planctomycetota bacterium]|nr:anhydro-N-acetylmuramic acid kinase [Planctomycetota bacterium]
MYESLVRFREKSTHRVVGLISGTSADGVDAAVCDISGEGRGNLKLEVLAKHTEPYPDFIREKVLAASDGGKIGEICELNFLIGEVFSQTTLNLLSSANIDVASVDLIGSHGQTVSHIPPRTDGGNYQLGSTLQLGEPSVIAERTGVAVISNFRTRDMAAGGQGAPLVPYVDYLLFSNDATSRIALNIGGISNITWLPKGGKLEDTLAYDTGPGNMIVDAMVHYMTRGDEAYDRDGSYAASGKINQALLNQMLSHPYLKRQPPKSTGREEFGVEYAVKMYEFNNHIMPRDIIATATAFTGISIGQSIKTFVQPRGTIDELIVSGGGAYNPVLMEHIRKELPDVKVGVSDDFGVPLKAKESLAFAVLARESALSRPSNLPSATGASGPRVLGNFTPCMR